MSSNTSKLTALDLIRTIVVAGIKVPKREREHLTNQLDEIRRDLERAYASYSIPVPNEAAKAMLGWRQDDYRRAPGRCPLCEGTGKKPAIGAGMPEVCPACGGYGSVLFAERERSTALPAYDPAEKLGRRR